MLRSFQHLQTGHLVDCTAGALTNLHIYIYISALGAYSMCVSAVFIHTIRLHTFAEDRVHGPSHRLTSRVFGCRSSCLRSSTRLEDAVILWCVCLCPCLNRWLFGLSLRYIRPRVREHGMSKPLPSSRLKGSES